MEYLEGPRRSRTGRPSLPEMMDDLNIYPKSSLEIAKNQLAEFFPTHRRQYKDVDLQNIARLMNLSEMKEWSSIPRIYTVLRTIDQLRLMDDFLEKDITDIWFPFSPGNLPSTIPPSTKAQFVDTQSIVFTPTLDLEKGENGHHVTFEDGELLWLESRCELGHGASGTVDKVLSHITLNEYARKRMLKGNNFTKSNKVIFKEFKNELDVLKKIDHEHCVKIIGSYTDPKYFGMIMVPVADCDLTTFLVDLHDHPDKPSILRSFFGCLGSAMQYLHENRIRHRDIKPRNVLVKGNKVYLADFGIALDWSEMAGGTTTDDTPKTHYYCAPEVAIFEPRGTSSDIWSLGCIFVEMVTVLKGKTVEDMRTFFMERSGNFRFCSNEEPCSQWLKSLNKLNPTRDNPPIRWASDMLHQDRRLRITADSLLDEIRRCSTYDPSRLLNESFCGNCCIRDEDPQPKVSNGQKARLRAESDNKAAAARNAKATLINSTRPPVSRSTPAPTTSTNLFRRSREREASDMAAAVFLRYNGFKTSELRGNGPLPPGVDIGGPALQWAAAHGHANVVRLLLDKGVPIESTDAADGTEHTALHFAAKNGHEAIVRLLLERRANIESEDDIKHRALHLAAKNGHVVVVGLLLERGADIEAKDIWENTALHLAAKNEHEAVVQLLLRNGAKEKRWYKPW